MSTLLTYSCTFCEYDVILSESEGRTVTVAGAVGFPRWSMDFDISPRVPGHDAARFCDNLLVDNEFSDFVRDFRDICKVADT